MRLDNLKNTLKEINGLQGLNRSNIIERIRAELEEIDSDIYREWKSRRFDVNHIFTIDYNIKATLLHFAAGCGCKNIVVVLRTYLKSS